MSQSQEPPSGIDLANPQVREMLKNAWAVVAKARARRLAREAEAREQEAKQSA